MENKAKKILEQYEIDNDYPKMKRELLILFSVSNSALIDYIENDAEIPMPIDELMHEDGSHLTKKEYGKVLLKYLVKELRTRYC